MLSMARSEKKCARNPKRERAERQILVESTGLAHASGYNIAGVTILRSLMGKITARSDVVDVVTNDVRFINNPG